MNKQEAVERLCQLTHTLRRADVRDRESYRAWRKRRASESLLARLFAYEREGKMPAISSLVAPDFHPELPLVLYNYTPVAHNTLWRYPQGWTPVLRRCRGIIFDLATQRLVSHPFVKFFNDGEHPETRKLPRRHFTATCKHDGHLVQAFEYNDRWLATSRGVFTSPTSQLAQRMLDGRRNDQLAFRWFNSQINPLFELIHPETHVHVDYQGHESLILIGAYDRKNLVDFDYETVSALGPYAGFETVQRWEGDSPNELRRYMKDLTVQNSEGYVGYFKPPADDPGADPLRVKFKFATYINLMVAAHLRKNAWRYVMRCLVDNKFERMLGNLPEETLMRALEMKRAIERVKRRKAKPLKEQRDYLYGLPPKELSTDAYRNAARDYLKRLHGVAIE